MDRSNKQRPQMPPPTRKKPVGNSGLGKGLSYKRSNLSKDITRNSDDSELSQRPQQTASAGKPTMPPPEKPSKLEESDLALSPTDTTVEEVWGMPTLPKDTRDMRKELWSRKASWRESIRKTYTTRILKSSQVREETLMLLQENMILDMEYYRDFYMDTLQSMYLHDKTPLTRTMERVAQNSSDRRSGGAAQGLQSIVDELVTSVFANYDELLKIHKEFYQNLTFFHTNIRTDFSVCVLRFVEGKNFRDMMEDMLANFLVRIESLTKIMKYKAYPATHKALSLPLLRRKRFGIVERITAPLGRDVEPVYFLVLPIFHYDVLLSWIQNEISFYQRRDSQCSDYFEAWSIVSSVKEKYLPIFYSCDEIMRLQDAVCFFKDYVTRIPSFIGMTNRYLRAGPCVEVAKGNKLFERHAILTYDVLLIGSVKHSKVVQDAFVSPSKRFSYVTHYSTEGFRIQDIGGSNKILLIPNVANQASRNIQLMFEDEKEKASWISSFLLIPSIREMPGHASIIQIVKANELDKDEKASQEEVMKSLPPGCEDLDVEFEEILSDVTGSLELFSCKDFWRKMEDIKYSMYFTAAIIVKMYSLELPMPLHLSIMMKKLREGTPLPPLPREYTSEEIETDEDIIKEDKDVLENHIHDSLVHTLYYVLLNYDIVHDSVFFNRARIVFLKYSQKSFSSRRMKGYPEICDILEARSRPFRHVTEVAKKDFINGIEGLSISKVGPERLGIKNLEEIDISLLGMLSSSLMLPYVLQLFRTKKINADRFISTIVLFLKHPSISEGRLLSLLELLLHVFSVHNMSQRNVASIYDILLGYFVWPRPYGQFAAYILQLVSEEMRLVGSSQWRMLFHSLPELFFDVPNPQERCLSVNLLFDVNEPFALPFQGLLLGGEERIPSLNDIRRGYIDYHVLKGLKLEDADTLRKKVKQLDSKRLSQLCMELQTVVERYTVDAKIGLEDFRGEVIKIQEKILEKKLSRRNGDAGAPAKVKTRNIRLENQYLLSHHLEYLFIGCSDQMALPVNKKNGLAQFPLGNTMKEAILKHLGMNEDMLTGEMAINTRNAFLEGEKPRRRILKFAICGGDSLLSYTMSSYVSLMQEYPLLLELAECVFYILPLGKDDESNRIAHYLGLYDGWYEDHVLKLLRIAPRILPTPDIHGFSPGVAAKMQSNDEMAKDVRNVIRRRRGSQRKSQVVETSRGSPFHLVRASLNNYFLHAIHCLDLCIFHVETWSTVHNQGISSLATPESILRKATANITRSSTLLSLTSTLDKPSNRDGPSGMFTYFRNFTFVKQLEFGAVIDKAALGDVFYRDYEPASLHLKFLMPDIIGNPIPSPTLLESETYEHVTCYNLHPSFEPHTKKIPKDSHLLVDVEKFTAKGKTEKYRALYLEVESSDQKKSFYVSVDGFIIGPFYKIRTKVLTKPKSHKLFQFKIASFFPLDFS